MTTTLSPPTTPPAVLADVPATAALAARVAEHIGHVAAMTVAPGHLVIDLENPRRAHLVADQYGLDLEESTADRASWEGYVDDVYVRLNGAPLTEEAGR